MKATVASEEELQHIDKMLENLDFDIAVSMAYVKRTQGLSFNDLVPRFRGLNKSMLQRYMQPSYSSMRPIHFVAAYSWITMVPMTSFYYGLKIREAYRGMDQDSVEAIICIGKIPSPQFNAILDIIYYFLESAGKKEIDQLKRELSTTYGELDQFQDKDFFPPDVLDIKRFAKDYYRSVAITARRFRETHKLSISTAARVLGLSDYQYKKLENPDEIRSFSMAIGFRAKIGFKIDSHVDFTSEMTQYPEFHNLRIAQHIRDILIVTSLKHLPNNKKKYIIKMLKELSKAHR